MFEKPFANPSTGEQGLIARTRVALLYRELAAADASLLVAPRASATAPFFAALLASSGTSAAAVAAAAQPARRLLLLEPCHEGARPGRSARLLRHAASCGVEVVVGAAASEARAGDAAVAWELGAARTAALNGAAVALVGPAAAEEDKEQTTVERLPGLSWLLPETLGLPSYESHDEGLAAWHRTRKK